MLLAWTKVSKIAWFFGIGHTVIMSYLIALNLQTFTVVEVVIFLNCGPILTVILGFFVKDEEVTVGSLIKVSVAFIGTFLITLGASKPVEEDNLAGRDIQWYNYMLMMVMPVIIALGNLAMG